MQQVLDRSLVMLAINQLSSSSIDALTQIDSSIFVITIACNNMQYCPSCGLQVSVQAQETKLRSQQHVVHADCLVQICTGTPLESFACETGSRAQLAMHVF